MSSHPADGPLGPRRFAPPRAQAELTELRATGLVLEEPPVPRIFDLTMWCLLAVIGGLVLWGLAVPLGKAQSLTATPLPPAAAVAISAPIDGRLAKILPTDGARVSQGETLATIQPNSRIEERATLFNRALQAGLDIELLNSLATGRKPDFNKLRDATPEMIEAARARHAGFISKRESERNEAKRSAEQAIAARDANDIALLAARNRLDDIMRQLETRMSSANRATLRSEQELAKAELVRLTAAQTRISDQIQRATRTLKDLDRRYAEAALDNARRVLVRYKETRKRLADLEKQSTDTQVTAPADGLIRREAAAAEAAMIKAGTPLFTLTPLAESAEFKIADIGDAVLTPGQSVTVAGLPGRIDAVEGGTAHVIVPAPNRSFDPTKPVTVAVPGSRQHAGTVVLGLLGVR